MSIIAARSRPASAAYLSPATPAEPATLHCSELTEIDADWPDPLIRSLGSMANLDAEYRVYLNGPPYELFVTTSSAAICFRLSNPQECSLIDVENALFSTANLLAELGDRQEIREYMAAWRRSITRRQ